MPTTAKKSRAPAKTRGRITEEQAASIISHEEMRKVLQQKVKSPPKKALARIGEPVPFTHSREQLLAALTMYRDFSADDDFTDEIWAALSFAYRQLPHIPSAGNWQNRGLVHPVRGSFSLFAFLAQCLLSADDLIVVADQVSTLKDFKQSFVPHAAAFHKLELQLLSVADDNYPKARTGFSPPQLERWNHLMVVIDLLRTLASFQTVTVSTRELTGKNLFTTSPISRFKHGLRGFVSADDLLNIWFLPKAEALSENLTLSDAISAGLLGNTDDSRAALLDWFKATGSVKVNSAALTAYAGSVYEECVQQANVMRPVIMGREQHAHLFRDPHLVAALYDLPVQAEADERLFEWCAYRLWNKTRQVRHTTEVLRKSKRAKSRTMDLKNYIADSGLFSVEEVERFNNSDHASDALNVDHIQVFTPEDYFTACLNAENVRLAAKHSPVTVAQQQAQWEEACRCAEQLMIHRIDRCDLILYRSKDQVLLVQQQSPFFYVGGLYKNPSTDAIAVAGRGGFLNLRKFPRHQYDHTRSPLKVALNISDSTEARINRDVRFVESHCEQNILLSVTRAVPLTVAVDKSTEGTTLVVRTADSTYEGFAHNCITLSRPDKDLPRNENVVASLNDPRSVLDFISAATYYSQTRLESYSLLTNSDLFKPLITSGKPPRALTSSPTRTLDAILKGTARGFKAAHPFYNHQDNKHFIKSFGSRYNVTLSRSPLTTAIASSFFEPHQVEEVFLGRVATKEQRSDQARYFVHFGGTLDRYNYQVEADDADDHWEESDSSEYTNYAGGKISHSRWKVTQPKANNNTLLGRVTQALTNLDKVVKEFPEMNSVRPLLTALVEARVEQNVIILPEMLIEGVNFNLMPWEKLEKLASKDSFPWRLEKEPALAPEKLINANCVFPKRAHYAVKLTWPKTGPERLVIYSANHTIGDGTIPLALPQPLIQPDTNEQHLDLLAAEEALNTIEGRSVAFLEMQNARNAYVAAMENMKAVTDILNGDLSHIRTKFKESIERVRKLAGVERVEFNRNYALITTEDIWMNDVSNQSDFAMTQENRYFGKFEIRIGDPYKITRTSTLEFRNIAAHKPRAHDTYGGHPHRGCTGNFSTALMKARVVGDLEAMIAVALNFLHTFHAHEGGRRATFELLPKTKPTPDMLVELSDWHDL